MISHLCECFVNFTNEKQTDDSNLPYHIIIVCTKKGEEISVNAMHLRNL